MSDAPDELHAWSVHSVKGGVGKSTLALLIARKLAERHRVALVDMDLTGTSLADVLDLEAPYWDGDAEILPLHRGPARWGDPQPGMRLRVDPVPEGPRGVPFLNDWFLHTRDAEHLRADVSVRALAWKPRNRGAHDRLWVLPSSALPEDIGRVLPLLYDEPFAAYVEGRLEWLLEALVIEGVRHVVFDTPPALAGLSRAVLSMALRLPEHQPMSTTGEGPPRLSAANVTWRPWIVTTLDIQDLLAVERWITAIEPPDSERLGIVLNRCDAQASEIQERLERQKGNGEIEDSAGGVVPVESPIFRARKPVCVRYDDKLRLFDVVRGRTEVDNVDGLEALIGDE